jgi:hypothetical protein
VDLRAPQMVMVCPPDSSNRAISPQVCISLLATFMAPETADLCVNSKNQIETDATASGQPKLIRRFGGTQHSLRKIFSFHGGDYEEFRLLGCNNHVRTSQETQSPLQSLAG